MKSLLHKLLWALLYLLPAVLFFSYYPIISLGANSSMNFELSLPLIWLVLFNLVAFVVLLTLPKSLKASPETSKCRPNHKVPPKSQSVAQITKCRPSLTTHLHLPGISDRRIFLFSLFPFFLTLSIFWSKNPLRGLLTAGIVWLLFFAIFTIIFILPILLKVPQNPQTLAETSQPSSKAPRSLKTRLLLSLFISTVAVCIFCFIQSILDTCGFPRTETLLCAGCTYRSFGFPHPSGFAIEPQFMGNLLLAPTLTAFYLLIFQTPKEAQTLQKASKTRKSQSAAKTSATSNPQKLLLTLSALLFATTLFFTFSRGAIYAFAVALLILFIFALIRRCLRPSLIAIPVVAFLLSLGLQGTFAALGPTSETFTSAVTKSIHQLSLGFIDLRFLAKDAKSLETDLKTSETDLKPDSPAADLIHDAEQEVAHFEGYVAESTNIRLNLNSTALATVLQSPATLIFGVGLGGAGTAMFEAFPEKVGSPKEIVQNETFSLLLETGLIGLFLVHFTLVLAFLAPLLPASIIDGKSAHSQELALTPTSQPATAPQKSKPPQKPQNFFQRQLSRLKTSDFWSHPALPLLSALIVAYIITLSFFSGLPNALQIYLMPPLLFFIFRLPDSQNHPK